MALLSRSFAVQQFTFAGGNADQAPVSQKTRNFSGLFRIPQFPLYLRNAEVLSHQTSQSSLFFLHQKHVKGLAFQTKQIAV